jgi:hypothetical protein
MQKAAGFVVASANEGRSNRWNIAVSLLRPAAVLQFNWQLNTPHVFVMIQPLNLEKQYKCSFSTQERLISLLVPKLSA